MSNEVYGIANKKLTGSGPRKAVLLAMADAASNDGSGIWTSKANIALDAEISKRSVQLAIQYFVKIGLVVEVGKRSCRNGFTVEYKIDLDRLKALPSTREKHKDEGVKDIHPCKTFTPHVNQIHPTREPHSPHGVNHIHPNHSVTIHEPLEEPYKEPTPIEILCQVIRHDTATDFAAHRKDMKKPLTVAAAKRLVAKVQGHHDPDAVFDESIANGWQGIFPERQNTGARNARNTTTDTTLEQIARAARFGAP